MTIPFTFSEIVSEKYPTIARDSQIRVWMDHVVKVAFRKPKNPT